MSNGVNPGSCPGHDPLCPDIEGSKTVSRGAAPATNFSKNTPPEGKQGVGMEHPKAANTQDTTLRPYSKYGK